MLSFTFIFNTFFIYLLYLALYYKIEDTAKKILKNKLKFLSCLVFIVSSVWKAFLQHHSVGQWPLDNRYAGTSSCNFVICNIFNSKRQYLIWKRVGTTWKVSTSNCNLYFKAICYRSLPNMYKIISTWEFLGHFWVIHINVQNILINLGCLIKSSFDG